MPTEEEIAEFMKTPEGALELQRILAQASPSSSVLSQFIPGTQAREDLAREEARTAPPPTTDPATAATVESPYSWAERGAKAAADAWTGFEPNPSLPAVAPPTGGALGQISDLELGQFRAASPTDGGIGQIGASPDIPGATRGLPPGVSGMNPVAENRRRMMQQLIPNRNLGLRY